MNRFDLKLHSALFTNNAERGVKWVVETAFYTIPEETQELINKTLTEGHIANNLKEEIRLYDQEFKDFHKHLCNHYGWDKQIKLWNTNVPYIDYVLACFVWFAKNNKTEISETDIPIVKNGWPNALQHFYDLFLKNQNLEKTVEETLENGKKTHKEKNQNNESIWTSKNDKNDKVATKLNEKQEAANNGSATEKMKADEKLRKELEKQLLNLAKNKKIDFPWTNNEWKCSGEEKKLAQSSAKVFIELLASTKNDGWNKVEDMIELCRNWNWDLDKGAARVWREKLKINSKEEDIQRFYKSFQEYQSHKSGFIHLQGLMGFFVEKWIDSRDELITQLSSERSQKISKKDIRKKEKTLYEWSKPKDHRERAKFEVIKDRLKTQNDPTEKMLTLLCDFNLDGEVNTWDVWYKTWSQFAKMYRVMKGDLALNWKTLRWDEEQINAPLNNLVAYANKMGLNLSNIENEADLYNWMTWNKWYENTRQLQILLQNSPADFNDILKNWADAGKDTYDNMIAAEDLKSEEVKKAQDAANNKSNEEVDKNQADIEKICKENSSNVMQHLKTSLSSAMMSMAVNAKKDWGFGLGAGFPLDQYIKWMSAGVTIWMAGNKPNIWLFVWYDKLLKAWNTTDISLWATAGTTLFIPFVGVSAGVIQDINKKARTQSLDAKWIKKVDLTADVTVWPWVVARWGAVWFENNKKAWVEQQAQNIRTILNRQALGWIEAIKDKETPTEKERALREQLKTNFPKSSKEELNSATKSLMRIVETFPTIDSNASNAEKSKYASIIADVYTDLWRNKAIIGMTDNKWKPSWWKVWIHFMAGFLPTLSLVAKFTRYTNARAQETENSEYRRKNALENWKGNKEVSLTNKKIWEEQIKQLNSMLAVTEADWLKYEAWAKGKLWKIRISKKLWQKISVRVNPDLKWYVTKDTTSWEYLFPANATYRLTTETGWNQNTAVLNIGKYDNSSLENVHNMASDVNITDTTWMDALIWNQELTSGKTFDGQNFNTPTNNITYNEIYNDTELFTNDVINQIKTIDSWNGKRSWKRFSAVMKNKVEAINDFNKAKSSLIDVLKQKEKTFKTIIEKLKDSKTSEEDSMLIMDTIMSMSAYVDKKDVDAVKQLINRRWKSYLNLKGPNNASIFNNLYGNEQSDPRLTHATKLNNDVTSHLKWDIIWATAFYNRNNTSQWLAITWLGATRVLWWQTTKLEWEKATAAKKWFLWEWESKWAISKEKSPVERSNLSNKMTTYIESVLKWKIKKIDGTETKISEENMETLLKWEEIQIELDKPSKIVKVKLDVEYVFYLMWECANESVGMKLWNLSVMEQVDDYAKGRLITNNGDGSSTTENRTQKAVFGTSMVWSQKNQTEKKPNYDNWSTPGDSTKPINWSTPGDGTKPNNNNPSHETDGIV